MHDYSGKPRAVNTGLLRLLLEHGYVPVLCIPILDETNTAINSENDDIVSLLVQELNVATVIQLIEAPGVLDNANDENSLVASISKSELEAREARVEGRMKRKILALRKLASSGATVFISDGRVEHPLQAALSGKGTTIR